jgi:hypothetical protein
MFHAIADSRGTHLWLALAEAAERQIQKKRIGLGQSPFDDRDENRQWLARA